MSAKREKRPLSSYAAFPLLVGLWFAALLGLGTYVVPPASFEGLVQASGIAQVLPAAAPPLGSTARLLIAGAAALVGLLLGLFVAYRIRLARSAEGQADDTAIETFDEDRSADGSVWLDGDDLPEEDASSDGDEIDHVLHSEPAAASPDVREFDHALPDEMRDEESDRSSADRLVAGLPVIGREDLDKDLESDWIASEHADEMPAIDVAGFEGNDIQADTLLAETDKLDEGVVDAPLLPERDPDDSRTDLQNLSLAELATRLRAALAASTGPSPRGTEDGDIEPATEENGDPVIAFLRREVDREQAFEPKEPGTAKDPQASLRSALERLDRVSRKS